MSETKSETVRRLKAEGRWREAMLYRTAVRERSKKLGKTPKEAREIAHAAMVKVFPPVSVEALSQSIRRGLDDEAAEGAWTEAEEEKLRAHAEILLDMTVEKAAEVSCRSEGIDLARDILWAYDNMGNLGVLVDESPSVGAWGLLDWARKHRAQFFDKMLPKALSVKEKEARFQRSEQEAGDLELERVEKLGELVKELMDGQHEMFCEGCWGRLSEENPYVEVVRHSKPKGKG